MAVKVRGPLAVEAVKIARRASADYHVTQVVGAFALDTGRNG